MSMRKYNEDTNHWIKQRLTAIAIIVFALCLFFVKTRNYGSVFRPELIFPLLGINILCIYHGMLGMRVIIEDYIKSTARKAFLISLINFIAIMSIIISLPMAMFVLFASAFGLGMSLFSFFIGIIAFIVFLYLLFKS